jgi:hypothetical protein
MNTVFISLGNTCQPAAILRNSGLRQEAFPFDWGMGSTDCVVSCIETDFAGFHTDLHFDSPHLNELGANTVLTDRTGFSFHHDYPTIEKDTLPVGDEFIRETTIVSNWQDFYPTVYAKYQRRISRFISLLRGPSHVICVCHRSMADCIRIRDTIKRVYGKNVVIITNSQEPSRDPMIVGYTHTDSESTGDFMRAVRLVKD